MQPINCTVILNRNATSDLKVTIELLESQMVQAALQKHKGNKSRAAERIRVITGGIA